VLTIRRVTSVGPTGVGAAALATGLLAGALPPLLGATLVVGLGAALATVASPLLGLTVLTFAIPFSPAEGSSLAQLPIAPSDALAVLILAAMVAALFTRRARALNLTGAFLPGVGLLVVIALSATGAADLAVSAKEALRWTAILGTMVVAATVCRRPADRRLVIAGLLGALVLESLVGWAEFLLRRGPEGFRIGSFLRAYGTFGQPNPFAGYLAMLLPLAFAVVIAARPWVQRPDRLALLALVASGVGTVALLMSLSRGALLGLVGAGLLLFWLNVRRGGLVVLAGVLGVLVVLGLESLHLVPALVSARLGQISEYVGWYDVSRVRPTPQNWAVIERMAHWEAAWRMYLDHPILGVGPGHYALAYPAYRVNDFWLDPLGHAHNLYLNVMAELGFLGILAYLGLVGTWALIVFRRYRVSGTALDRALTSGVLAGLLAVAIHNVFDNLLVHGLGTQMGLLVGLTASIGWSPPGTPKETG
jgi:putative inorganic carbon (hco3(-)) transporter